MIRSTTCLVEFQDELTLKVWGRRCPSILFHVMQSLTSYPWNFTLYRRHIKTSGHSLESQSEIILYSYRGLLIFTGSVSIQSVWATQMQYINGILVVDTYRSKLEFPYWPFLSNWSTTKKATHRVQLWRSDRLYSLWLCAKRFCFCHLYLNTWPQLTS